VALETARFEWAESRRVTKKPKADLTPFGELNQEVTTMFPTTPWAVLLCKFNDDDSGSFPRDYYESKGLLRKVVRG
jgi:hypothetical protein